VISVIGDSEGAVDHLGHPARGPHVPAKAIRFGSFGLQRWNMRLDDPVLDAKPGIQLEKLLVRARRALPRKRPRVAHPDHAASDMHAVRAFLAALLVRARNAPGRRHTPARRTETRE